MVKSHFFRAPSARIRIHGCICVICSSTKSCQKTQNIIFCAAGAIFWLKSRGRPFFSFKFLLILRSIWLRIKTPPLVSRHSETRGVFLFGIGLIRKKLGQWGFKCSITTRNKTDVCACGRGDSYSTQTTNFGNLLLFCKMVSIFRYSKISKFGLISRFFL